MAQIILRQQGRDEVIQLAKDVTSVGRTPDNDIIIRGEGVSRRHCEIRRIDDGYMMIDMGSRNGTHVNGVRITEQKLSMGDLVAVGDAVIVFEKEILAHQEAVDKQVSQSDNFISATRESHVITVIFVLVIIGGIVGIVLWRMSLPVTVDSVRNLLGANASFESLTASPGQAPERWEIFPKSGVRCLITQDEKHSGNRALIVERTDNTVSYTVAYYDNKILLPKDIGTVTFGGWMKSDSFNKSAAGFKLEWFREDEANPFLETYTDFVIPKDQWQDISVSVPVPPACYALQFSCLSAGGTGKVYFDDIKIIPSARTGDAHSSDGYLVVKEISAKDQNELKLTGYYNGTWMVAGRDNTTFIRSGGFVVKTDTAENRQDFSTSASPQASASRRKMFFPDSAEWFDYEINFDSSLNAVSAKYAIPPQKLSSKINSIYLRCRIPAHLISEKLKVRGTALKEVSFRETIKESNVSQVEITMGDNILVIKYPLVFDISITPQGDELEITQGIFSRERLSRYRNEVLPLEIAFELKPFVRESLLDIQYLLEKGKELETNEQLGEARGVYLDVIGQVEKETPLWNNAQQGLKRISDKAEQDLGEIRVLLEEAELLSSTDSSGLIEEKCKRISLVYKNTEYAQESLAILDKIKEIGKNLKKSVTETDQKTLLSLAEGYLKESKWSLVRVFAQRILAFNPDSAEGKRAKEILEIIKQKEQSD